MAFSFLPGVGEITVPLSMAAGAVRGVVGDEKYEKSRDALTWGYSAFIGFVPFNLLSLPFQIGMFIVFLFLFIFLFNMGWWSAPMAYIVQGLVTMCFYHWLGDKAMRYGVGI